MLFYKNCESHKSMTPSFGHLKILSSPSRHILSSSEPTRPCKKQSSRLFRKPLELPFAFSIRYELSRRNLKRQQQTVMERNDNNPQYAMEFLYEVGLIFCFDTEF